LVLPKRPCGVCLIPDLLLTIFFYPPTIDPASCRDSATDCVVTHVPSWYVFQSAAGHRTSGYASRRMVHKMWCRLGAFPMPGLKLQKCHFNPGMGIAKPPSRHHILCTIRREASPDVRWTAALWIYPIAVLVYGIQ